MNLPVTLSPPTETSSCTSSQLIEFSHKWSINNFSSYLIKRSDSAKTDVIQSTEFCASTNEHFKFHLKLEVQGETNKNYMDIFLYLADAERSKVALKWQLSILNARGNKCRIQVLRKRFYRNSSGWGWYNYVPHHYLLDPIRAWLPNDTLTLICEISYITNQRTFTLPGDNFASSLLSSKMDLLKDCSNLLQSGKHYDLVICVNGIDFRVHKNIVLTRCPVLGQMFEFGTKEAIQNRVELDDDVQVNVFRQMLEYIYCGKVKQEELDKCAAELLTLADKFDLPELKQICEQLLCDQLTTKSVIDFLVLADIHGANELKCTAINHICKNLSTVLSLTNWKRVKMNRPKLYIETLHQIIPMLSKRKPIALVSNHVTAHNKLAIQGSKRARSN